MLQLRSHMSRFMGKKGSGFCGTGSADSHGIEQLAVGLCRRPWGTSSAFFSHQ